jgi:hypothetical protein
VPIDKKTEPKILIAHLMEGIGIALDIPGDRMFVTDFAGSVYSADLDGKNERNFLYAQGNLTGIAYAEVGLEEFLATPNRVTSQPANPSWSTDPDAL